MYFKRKVYLDVANMVDEDRVSQEDEESENAACGPSIGEHLVGILIRHAFVT